MQHVAEAVVLALLAAGLAVIVPAVLYRGYRTRRHLKNALPAHVLLGTSFASFGIGFILLSANALGLRLLDPQVGNLIAAGPLLLGLALFYVAMYIMPDETRHTGRNDG